jgi:hypothetical protein
MFYIGFTAAPQPDSAGIRRAAGEITMDEHSATFTSPVQHWTMAAYEVQWRAAVARLAGETSSAFITSCGGAGGAMHTVWPLYRDGARVIIRDSREIVGPEHARDVIVHVYEQVASASSSTSGREWSLELGRMLAFVVDQ